MEDNSEYKDLEKYIRDYKSLISVSDSLNYSTDLSSVLIKEENVFQDDCRELQHLASSETLYPFSFKESFSF